MRLSERNSLAFYAVHTRTSFPRRPLARRAVRLVVTFKLLAHPGRGLRGAKATSGALSRLDVYTHTHTDTNIVDREWSFPRYVPPLGAFMLSW